MIFFILREIDNKFFGMRLRLIQRSIHLSLIDPSHDNKISVEG